MADFRITEILSMSGIQPPKSPLSGNFKNQPPKSPYQGALRRKPQSGLKTLSTLDSLTHIGCKTSSMPTYRGAADCLSLPHHRDSAYRMACNGEPMPDGLGVSGSGSSGGASCSDVPSHIRL